MVPKSDNSGTTGIGIIESAIGKKKVDPIKDKSQPMNDVPN